MTLIELLVVIGIIVLLMAIALPSIARMFTSGADSEARNIIQTQLSSARALAVKDRQFAGIHIQKDWEGDETWVAVVEYQYVNATGDGNKGNMANWRFDGVEGYAPIALPGGLAVGEVSSDFVDGSGNYRNVDAAPGHMADFTSMTIVFDPDGQLTIYPSVVSFGPASKLLNADTNDKKTIWTGWPTPDENSVTALCVCNGTELNTAVGAGTANVWLNEYAQFLPVNRYTGGLIRGAKQ